MKVKLKMKRKATFNASVQTNIETVPVNTFTYENKVSALFLLYFLLQRRNKLNNKSRHCLS